MTLAVPTAADRAAPQVRRALSRQTLLIAAVLLVVVWADQTSKGWAWRHLSDVHVNSGGNAMTGAHLSGWLRDPVRGALLDVLDGALLVAAGLLLARMRRSPGVTIFATLALGGWSSNLLDRLGMHLLTAPGSVRGAVDFLPFGGHYWNLADVSIVVGSTGLAPALCVAAARAVGTRPAARVTAYRPLASRRAPVLIAGGLAVVVALAVYGVLNYAGVDGTPDTLLFGG